MPVTGRMHDPYFENDGNLTGVGSSSVHEDTSDFESLLEVDDIEHDIGQIPGNLHIPHYSSKKRSPPHHRSSEPIPVHGSTSGYQNSNYASSEPPPNFYAGRREYFSKDKSHRNDTKNTVHAQYERQFADFLRTLGQNRMRMKAADAVAEAKVSENESLRIRLFHSLKDAKKYEEAEELYLETVKGRDPTKSEDLVILDLKHSFAGILIAQKRFQEAEPISRAVWARMEQSRGPPSELFKQSHRQLCSVLCAVGRPKDAEIMNMLIYQRGNMDAWALENGDEVCQRRREQKDIKRAKEMQDEVRKERLKRSGPTDGLTIRSGLRLIGFLEELVKNLNSQRGTDAERRLHISQKQAFECEIEMILPQIWSTRRQPEPNTDILDAGYKLGVFLFRRELFPEAGAIFEPVWEGQKQQLGDNNASTMATGSMLGRALYRQEIQESYHKAVNVFRTIWLTRQTVMNGDAEAISSGEELAQACRLLEKWPEAEQAYAWIIQQTERKRGYPTSKVDDARWNLGQTLWKQGKAKECKAEKVLGELYHRWNATSPNSNRTLECGQMLAQSISTQKGRVDDALKIFQDVFNARGASAKRGVTYLDSGYLYGSLLLKVAKFAEAERSLKSVWEFQPREPEEEILRLKCGYLYGQALAKSQKCVYAKKILEAVVAGQEANPSARVPETVETRQFLEKVNRYLKEKARVKQNSYHRSGHRNFE